MLKPLRCDTPESVPGMPSHTRNRRYSAFMKNLHVVSPLLASLLLGSMALAQVVNTPVPEAPQPQSSSSMDLEQIPSTNTLKPGGDKPIAQARRYPGFPGGPMGPRRGMYAPGFAPRPALSPFGVLIGFGVGAALGASQPADGTVKGHVALGVIGGTIGAVIGGAIGAANPFRYSRRTYRPSWPDDGDDEESHLRSPSRRSHSQRSVSAKAASPSTTTASAATVPGT